MPRNPTDDFTQIQEQLVKDARMIDVLGWDFRTMDSHHDTIFVLSLKDAVLKRAKELYFVRSEF